MRRRCWTTRRSAPSAPAAGTTTSRSTTPTKSCPASGISIGLTRLFYVLGEQGMLNPALPTAPADVLMLPMTDDLGPAETATLPARLRAARAALLPRRKSSRPRSLRRQAGHPLRPHSGRGRARTRRNPLPGPPGPPPGWSPEAATYSPTPRTPAGKRPPSVPALPLEDLPLRAERLPCRGGSLLPGLGRPLPPPHADNSITKRNISAQ
jgi:hypothetical protein